MISIYLLTNTNNGKKYVGQTNNFSKRMREHSYASNDCSISKAVRKHGWSAFTTTMLEECDDITAARRETEFIALYQSKGIGGYNETAGGEGSRGYIVKPETRNKQREAKLGKPLSPEHAQKIRNAMIGRSVSAETRHKISIGNRGKRKIGHKASPEHKAKLSTASKGKPKSDAHKAALSLAKLGTSWSDRQRATNIMTPERRAKLSVSHAKQYTLTSPTGILTNITNMTQFCKDMGIAAPSAMIAVHSGKKPQYLGWTR